MLNTIEDGNNVALKDEVWATDRLRGFCTSVQDRWNFFGIISLVVNVVSPSVLLQSEA